MNEKQRDRIRVGLVAAARGLALALLLGLPPTAGAQIPDLCGCAGSPESLGEFDSSDDTTWPTIDGVVTSPSGSTITLPVPEDGVLVFDSFTADNTPSGSNATVVFRRTPTNAPIRLLVAGDFVLGGGDFIVLNGTAASAALGNPLTSRGGLGAPGGFRGGDGAVLGLRGASHGGDGFGPGGGAALDPAGGRVSGEGGTWVGAADLVPLIGGSGGGGGSSVDPNPDCVSAGGGGGGGALLVVANGRATLNGRIQANGGNAAAAAFNSSRCSSSGAAGSGAGSGGAVRVVAGEIVGVGSITATGGAGFQGGNPGGPGRIRLESARLDNFTGSTNPDAVRPTSPGPVASPLDPSVTITRVADFDVPEPPAGWRGSNAAVDLLLPAPGPVVVELATSGVPSGTLVDVSVKPRTGGNARVESAVLAGCSAAGDCTAAAGFDLDAGAYVVEAFATFALP